MKGVSFNLQGNNKKKGGGVFEITSISLENKWRFRGEPTSVLDTRRSPSPPTSSSTTLSSSFAGSTSGSADTAGVAAVSDNPKSVAAQVAVAELPSRGGGGGEWVSELQPIPTTGLDSGVEKCGGLGMEDWENMLSESSVVAASPGQEQSLLRWIMGDVEDTSSGFKQFMQGGGGPSEFEGGNAGFGIVDPSFGFEPMGAASVSASSMNVSLGVGAATVSPLSLPNSSSLPNFNKVPNFGSNPIFSTSSSLPISMPNGVFYQQQQFEEKPQILNPQFLMNLHQNHPTQNQSFFVPLPHQQDQHLLMPPHAKRHQPGIMEPGSQIPKVQFLDSGQDLFFRRQQQQQQQQQQQGFPHQLQQLLPSHHQQRPMMAATKPKVDEVAHQQLQQQALMDQLFKAAEMVEVGNSVHARAILARLNHQLSPIGKPLQRAAFYFKEALLLLTNNNNNNPVTYPPRFSDTEALLKYSSYNALSEISPIAQFANFTCNQAFLEALEVYRHIHIIDFDIGVGEQWASFIQEIASRIGGSPSLRITAITSPLSHDHPAELDIARESLVNFANELGISFEIKFVNLDSFDPTSWSLALDVLESEAVAVNIPVGFSMNYPSMLRLMKQLLPKIVVSVDRGCERYDLTFSHHFLNSLQTYSILLDSLDAVNVNPDTVNKIERFFLQRQIESSLLGRHQVPEKMPPWRTLFSSAGFSTLNCSNYTETQAEYMVKKLQVRGFHVDKRQNSLVLCWQRRELLSVTAWSC
ncbi:hypothetical protein GIB67_021790 [Kingdonia uniflora]|uniref:Uncharacterized protein n=1 Tax=Kingdonia uniflora TaxID=39325 RepID=A0A7J7P3F2_9MAGN|nr:hypothetical protein GIB67_021790 [Kingdonia uniflora]